MSESDILSSGLQYLVNVKHGFYGIKDNPNIMQIKLKEALYVLSADCVTHKAKLLSEIVGTVHKYAIQI